VLLSGGVGLTPMVSILDTLVDRRAARPVWHVHTALTGRHHAMKDHVRHVADEHGDVNAVVFYEFPSDDDVLGEDFDVAGRITLDWIKRELPTAEADFYFCGPKGFMRMLALGLRALDVPEEHIHFEFFGPPQDLYA
jgi:nitric oxide dioxygenase